MVNQSRNSIGGEQMYPSINAEMARNNYTNKTLGEKMGVSEKTVSNWRCGRTDIPSVKLIEMSRLFGVTTDYLLGVKKPAT
jgi:transcriptional regulator with XRE-family HTH domain